MGSHCCARRGKPPPRGTWSPARRRSRCSWQHGFGLGRTMIGKLEEIVLARRIEPRRQGADSRSLRQPAAVGGVWSASRPPLARTSGFPQRNSTSRSCVARRRCPTIGAFGSLRSSRRARSRRRLTSPDGGERRHRSSDASRAAAEKACARAAPEGIVAAPHLLLRLAAAHRPTQCESRPRWTVRCSASSKTRPPTSSARSENAAFATSGAGDREPHRCDPRLRRLGRIFRPHRRRQERRYRRAAAAGLDAQAFLYELAFERR